MSIIEQKAYSLGLKIPEAPKPVAAYIPGVMSQKLIFTSGQLPIENGEIKYIGKAGDSISAEEAYQAAKLCALNCLGVIKSLVKDLDQVERIIKITGFVNSTESFTEQPQVVNGASELVSILFGEKGAHARCAVGVNSLPLGVVCEVEMIVQVR